MADYKEFQGKTLDDAIREACEYYGVPREKLEIEIVSDAKTGIFGLVGVKKATIRAGRVRLSGTALALLEDGGAEDAPVPAQGSAAGKPRQAHRMERAEKPAVAAKKAKPAGRPETPASASAETAGGSGAAKSSAASPEGAPHRAPGRGRTAGGGRKQAGYAPKTRFGGDDAALPVTDDGAKDTARERDDLPDLDLAACDRDTLLAVVEEVVLRLVEPMVGRVPCEVAIAGSRVRITLDCGDAAGLLVGRDGQTLAAVQYLATRIISRKIGGAIRLQVDAGKYRERQDDKLKEQALSLAARVRETGRPLSTRPLTAYQRRIVHLVLEQDASVQTHSKGEGAQRKVVISLRKDEGESEADPAVTGE